MNLLLCLIQILIGLFIIYCSKRIYDYRKLEENFRNHLVDDLGGFLIALFSFRLFKKHIGVIFQERYAYLKSKNITYESFYLLHRKKFVLLDPEYIKNVLQQDFQYFTERGFFHNEKDDFLSANLFAIGGEKWKNIRSKLSPAFTASKIKGIFETFLECGYQLESAVTHLYKNKEVLDFKKISNCYSINVISSCAFGLNSNCFASSNSEFQKQGNRIFEMSPFRVAKIMIAFIEPRLGRFLKIRLFDNQTTHFFTNIVREVVTYRKLNNVTRKDIMQQLIELKNSQDGKAVSIEEITAHAFIFFAAGFETSSTTLTVCLYELSLNLVIQNKLRGEIKQVLQKHDENLSYESIMEMTYMNQVINETLRKYPPVPYITRVCVEDYNMPNTNVAVTKGTEIVVPIYALHRDPDFYPNPDKFDPERFSNENKNSIPQFTFLPFGEGPRICIGMRFGVLQLKIALTLLLQKYEFSINKSTEVPFKIKPLSFTFVPQNKVLLDIREI